MPKFSMVKIGLGGPVGWEDGERWGEVEEVVGVVGVAEVEESWDGGDRELEREGERGSGLREL